MKLFNIRRKTKGKNTYNIDISDIIQTEINGNRLPIQNACKYLNLCIHNLPLDILV